jgi:RNA polymerase sigma-70 factor, ECF subfamily
MNERNAIARLKRGDISGLEALVRLYQVRAVRAATLITHDRALAEDIVQAAFIRAYERIDQFDAARPFGPWFLRSVVNDAVKAVTRRRPQVALDGGSDGEPELALPDPASGPDELLEQAETQEAIWEALAQLPPAQRGAVVLRYYLGFSEAEIAAEQDCPPGTVKWRLHTARQRLRDLLTPWRTTQQPHTADSAASSRTSHVQEQRP